MLFFFSPLTYAVLGTNCNSIALENRNDIRQLNKLQYIAASQNIYFKDYRYRNTIERLGKSLSAMRSQTRPKLDIFSNEDKARYSKIYYTYTRFPNITFNTTFCKVRKRVEAVPPEERPFKFRFVPPG